MRQSFAARVPVDAKKFLRHHHHCLTLVVRLGGITFPMNCRGKIIPYRLEIFERHSLPA